MSPLAIMAATPRCCFVVCPKIRPRSLAVCGDGCLGERRATPAAKLRARRILERALEAMTLKCSTALYAEAGVLWILGLAVRTAHSPSPGRRRSTVLSSSTIRHRAGIQKHQLERPRYVHPS